MRPAIAWWPTCCTNSAIACRPIARRFEGRATQTGLPSSSLSIPKSRRPCGLGSRSSLSMPKRRSWSGISRMLDGSGNRRGHRCPYGSMISLSQHSAASPPMASTTSPTTRAGSTWERTTTRRLRGRKYSSVVVCDGQATYPQAKTLLITADSGGSNGSRVRLWKRALQQFADETGLEIAVCHFPPGTSKWNKIEHRLFSFISQNWRGKPLVSHEVIVNLIAATTTKTGLTAVCALDQNSYPAGVKVSKQDMAALQLQRDAFHGEWNYTILPRLQS